jgi:hypothetical protein
MKWKLAEILGLLVLCALVIIVSIAVVGGGSNASASTEVWTNASQVNGWAQLLTP